MNKLLSRKGSATIEAAIVIPIIVISILSVLFLIKIAYIHYSVQMALDSAVNEVGHYSYLYEKTGIREKTSGYKEVTSEMEGSAQEVIDNIYTIKNSFNEIGDIKKSEQQWVNEEEEVHITELINHYIETTKAFADRMVTVKESAQKMYDSIDAIDEVLFEGGVGVLSRQLEKFVLNSLTLKLMSRNLDESITSFIYNGENEGIVEGVEAFDMSLSNYFEEENDYKLDVVVIYKVKNPLPFNLVGDIKLMNRVVVDPWIGGIE